MPRLVTVVPLATCCPQQTVEMCIRDSNGGGKTTLLKTLLGLLRPLGGQVELDGQPLHTLSAAARARRLAYVPQSHVGAFAFSVADLVLMGRTAHGSLFAALSLIHI